MHHERQRSLEAQLCWPVKFINSHLSAPSSRFLNESSSDRHHSLHSIWCVALGRGSHAGKAPYATAWRDQVVRLGPVQTCRVSRHGDQQQGAGGRCMKLVPACASFSFIWCVQAGCVGDVLQHSLDMCSTQRMRCCGFDIPKHVTCSTQL